MIAKHRFRLCTAALALSGFAMGCRAMPLASEAPTPAASKPRNGLWISYSGSGVVSSTTPNGDGTMTVSTGDLRSPVFSVRLRSIAKDGTAQADLLTPASVDRDYFLVGDLHEDQMSGDPYQATQRLVHHRRRDRPA